MTPTTVLPPPPRDVVIEPGGPAAVGCVGRGMSVLLAVAALFALAVVPVRVYVQLAGRPISAVVDGLDASRSRKGTLSYHVRFHYGLDGQRYTDRQQVSQSEFQQWHVGDALTGRAAVLFGRAVCLTSAGNVFVRTLVLGAVAVVFAGIVAIFVYGAWIAPRRLRQLIATGTAVRGEVLTNNSYHGRRGRSVSLCYRFDTPGGTVQGSQNVSGSAADRVPAVGHPITVVYDPAKPTRNVAYECSGVSLRPMVG